MKYSDQQRIVKIYEYASKLNAYIKEHHVTQEEVFDGFLSTVVDYNATVQYWREGLSFIRGIQSYT